MPNARKKRQREAVVALGSKCHYCDAEATTLDHIVPKVALRKIFQRQGQYSHWRDRIDNGVPACEPCNRKKSDSWPTCTCSKCQKIVQSFMAFVYDLALDEDRRYSHLARWYPV